MTNVNLSARLEISMTVEEMSVTIAEMSATVEEISTMCPVEKIKELRFGSITLHTDDAWNIV